MFDGLLSNQSKRALFGRISRWIGPPLIKGLRNSNQYRIFGNEYLKRFQESNTNFILSFWHGQMLPLLFYITQSSYDHSRFHTFISPHRDGEYVTQLAKGLGINALRTSKRDRRIKALGEGLKKARNGENLAITPDGPVGPAFEAKEGIIRLSEKTKLPILPSASISSRSHFFSSWDRFCLPYPLGTIYTKFAKPVSFWQRDQSLQEKTNELQSTLNNLTIDLLSMIPSITLTLGELRSS